MTWAALEGATGMGDCPGAGQDGLCALSGWELVRGGALAGLGLG